MAKVLGSLPHSRRPRLNSALLASAWPPAPAVAGVGGVTQRVEELSLAAALSLPFR